MSLSMSSGAETDPRSNGEDESVGEMDVVLESTASGDVVSSTKRHRNSSSKPPYQAFLGQLYALIEGAIDSNRCVYVHIYVHKYVCTCVCVLESAYVCVRVKEHVVTDEVLVLFKYLLSTSSSPLTLPPVPPSFSLPPLYPFLSNSSTPPISSTLNCNRYEDSCRQLLGNKSYTLFGLDKVIQQTLKCLQVRTRTYTPSITLNLSNL